MTVIVMSFKSGGSQSATCHASKASVLLISPLLIDDCCLLFKITRWSRVAPLLVRSVCPQTHLRCGCADKRPSVWLLFDAKQVAFLHFMSSSPMQVGETHIEYGGGENHCVREKWGILLHLYIRETLLCPTPVVISSHDPN